MRDFEAVLASPVEGERLPRRDDGLTAERLERVVALLRFCRYRLSVLRLRVHGASPVFGGLLVRRALGDMGYAGQLRGGDSLFLHVGDCAFGKERPFDADVEQDIIQRLSRGLAELGHEAPRVRALISVAHVWSDAVSDSDELVQLVTRLAPKSDITVPVHEYQDVCESALAMTASRAAAV